MAAWYLGKQFITLQSSILLFLSLCAYIIKTLVHLLVICITYKKILWDFLIMMYLIFYVNGF